MKNQVKVQKTNPFKNSQADTIVCSGKLLLLPCGDGEGVDAIRAVIFSPTEPIEISERWINTLDTTLGVRTATYIDVQRIKNSPHCCKVLATTENLSSKQINAIIDCKLRNGDDVLVECEELVEIPKEHLLTGSDIEKECRQHPFLSIKFDRNNRITLFPVPKSESSKEDKLEQLATLLRERGLRKYTCINDSGYSQVERDIVDLLQDTSKVEFAKSLIENFDAKWEMFIATPQDLIGKTVISIRPGFGNVGGQIMLIKEADQHNIKLVKTAGSSYVDDNHLGWGCKFSEKHTSFIFLK